MGIEKSEGLTCWSCDRHRRVKEGTHAWRHICGAGQAGAPEVSLGECAHASYEPGSDEAEAGEVAI